MKPFLSSLRGVSFHLLPRSSPKSLGERLNCATTTVVQQEIEMPKFLSVGDAARKLNVSPRKLTDLLYRQILLGDTCPLIGGRRFIPASYLGEIEKTLQARKRREA